MDLEILLKKPKIQTAAYIQSECKHRPYPTSLNKLLNHLLDPEKPIDDFDTIDWCKKLMAGGLSLDEFQSTVQRYDTTQTCGLVWTANFIAYRCRTCGISPCMSLCSDCFKRGNHTGHDYNMFRSQAGGACDCGDVNVMKADGFCASHGLERRPSDQAPGDLLLVPNYIVPRLIARLLIYMRENSNSLTGFLGAIEKADAFITMIYECSCMGGAMRDIIVEALVNKRTYKDLMEPKEERSSTEGYAFGSLVNVEVDVQFREIPSLNPILTHTSFLEEFIFWTAKFEFPQKLVCLLLNLLPDSSYKESFTRAFILHYSRISQLLINSSNPDILSNRIVHVSVQLFSNEKLALLMTKEMKLLHVMILSLKSMIEKITCGTVDCGHLIMKDHCYWPIVSDLNNILSHKSVALIFMEDEELLSVWFRFLRFFQGMNINRRELNQHIEFEPSTYYAAFSAELEISASPMWALITHLKDPSTVHLTKKIISHCYDELIRWYDEAGDIHENEISFHLPLHRWLSVFINQAIQQGETLSNLIPMEFLWKLMKHPLNVQVGFYEIISGLWVRNGLQIKGQAMTYIQCHFCNSMVDADLYLLQTFVIHLDADFFMDEVIKRFYLTSMLSLKQCQSKDMKEQTTMLENFFVFIATLISVRTNLGIPNEELLTLEMITLLTMGDKTHSQLLELIPERLSSSKDFEKVLERVSDYHAPNFEHGNMLQGMYSPKACVWEELYDPIYVLLRAVHRRDFQTSLDRYSVATKKQSIPFRLPRLVQRYKSPSWVLKGYAHALIFIIFYKANYTNIISDQLISLALYLIEVGLAERGNHAPDVKPTHPEEQRRDLNLTNWYDTDDLIVNLRTVIHFSDEEQVEDVAMKDEDEPDCSDKMDVEQAQQSHCIISLMLLLNSKYTNSSYKPGTNSNNIYLSQILEKISQDEECRQLIESSSSKLATNVSQTKSNLAEASRLRKMEEMKRRQTDFTKAFMEEYDDEDCGGEYDCVICNLKSKSTQDCPTGLVVLMQPSHLLGWQTASPRPTLPATDQLSNTQAGVFIQTCGHYLHYECILNYLNTLKSQQRQANVSIERGEYSCPLCRQLSNSFLPIVCDGIEPGTRMDCAILKVLDDVNSMQDYYIKPPKVNSNLVRVNLELELSTAVKNSCIAPLIGILRLSHISQNSYERLIGDLTATNYAPLLLSDPIDLLIDVCLSKTLTAELFSFTVQKLFNLLYIQLAMKKLAISTNLDRESLETYLKNSICSGTNRLNPEEFTKFIRLSSLLKSSIFNEQLENCDEFSYYCHYLGLGSGNKIEDFLRFSTEWDWTNELRTLAIDEISDRIMTKSTVPSLLQLPQLYDSLFQHYNLQNCKQCNKIPKDPSVCLICGSLVCLREPCCKDGLLHEGTKHSITCGVGTCIYLSVNSSTIVVIRGKRACLWGSVYLDSYGEEDRELKRGKPLYLSKDRYDLLQQQWVNHRFDHTSRKWIFHRDTL